MQRQEGFKIKSPNSRRLRGRYTDGTYNKGGDIFIKVKHASSRREVRKNTGGNAPEAEVSEQVSNNE